MSRTAAQYRSCPGVSVPQSWIEARLDPQLDPDKVPRDMLAELAGPERGG